MPLGPHATLSIASRLASVPFGHATSSWPGRFIRSRAREVLTESVQRHLGAMGWRSEGQGRAVAVDGVITATKGTRETAGEDDAGVGVSAALGTRSDSVQDAGESGEQGRAGSGGRAAETGEQQEGNGAAVGADTVPPRVQVSDRSAQSFADIGMGTEARGPGVVLSSLMPR